MYCETNDDTDFADPHPGGFVHCVCVESAMNNGELNLVVLFVRFFIRKKYRIKQSDPRVARANTLLSIIHFLSPTYLWTMIGK